jgi:hypothetical protein
MLSESEILSNIKELNYSEVLFLIEIGSVGILRKFLNSEQIKLANSLVNRGLLEKGTSDDGKKNVIYYVDSFVERRL